MYFVVEVKTLGGETPYQEYSLYLGPFGSLAQAERSAASYACDSDSSFLVVKTEKAYKRSVKVNVINDPSQRAVA